VKLVRIKCFTYDNNGHLAKDFPKPPWVNICIFQGGLMVEIGAHKNETSNLLKLNCKINNKVMCFFLVHE
jgi:hypothetical protein